MTIGAFYVEDMTSLRYAIPFIKTTKRLLNVDVPLLYNSKANLHKYNSIDRYKGRFASICRDNNITVKNVEQIDHVKSLFCIENVTGGIVFENCYSIQHGFDYTVLHDKSKSTYLVSEEYFKNELEKLGKSAIVTPTPIAFWDWKFYIDNVGLVGVPVSEKISTLFYPESGLQDIFQLVKKRLESLGYKICIKQRLKNQLVVQGYENVFYDDLWYPTESILLPIISNFSVGLGTSAYTDLVHLNREFIDLSIPDYSKKYYKPQKENFTSISSDYYQNFCKLVHKEITLEEKLANPCDDLVIFDFLQRIIYE